MVSLSLQLFATLGDASMILCLDKYLVGILGNRRETTARKLAKGANWKMSLRIYIDQYVLEFTGCPML